MELSDLFSGSGAVIVGALVLALLAGSWVVRHGQLREWNIFGLRFARRCEPEAEQQSSPAEVAALERLAAVFGDRRACVARELTKLHEEFARGSLTELATQFKEGARGEVTLVVAGATARAAVCDPADLDAAIRELAEQGHSSREISVALARTSGLPKREVYGRAVALKATAAGREND